MKKEKQTEEVEEKYTFLQKLLYLFIIPLLFTLVIVLGYLTYEGKNIFEVAQSFLPAKEEVITTEEDKEEEEGSSSTQNDNTNSSQEIILLERQVSDKEREITKLVASLEEANSKIEDLEKQQQDIRSSTKELAKLYEGMSTNKAAQIIIELDEDMALLILNELSTSKTSSILGQLEPEQAARFTELLADKE
ncbi:MotE family protein [Sutcliffiella horikoshii]|uniref:MotE family protein n=1 Tax=Sutcliffiella horikoshii TaxID=79883 RepID=UPI003CEE06F7